ncbi:hypothetical protein [Shewanella sp. SR43-8]|uniref:hypothetical protein n=1 Tax=Shewanella sp. SR43-8 TaxID=2760938 RepID=UPI00160345F9|nr:hypothetical protein [Shewanella sp. SR43-8]MBB1323550.1 hypothetical protein [Shewanella sp. SR43-8]
MSKDALPKQSLVTMLDESFKQLKAEYQTGQPVVFSTGNISNLFLPPPNEVMKLFGISNPILFGIEVAEQDLNLPLDIKSSSRHKLTTSGVGLPSAKKMFRWSRELFSRVVTDSSIFNGQDIAQSALVNSNALGWYSLLNNSEEMQRANTAVDFDEFKPLLIFLTQRCKDDVECFEHIKQQVDKQGIEDMTLSDKLQLQAPLWLGHSEVGHSTWKMFCRVLQQHKLQQIKDKESELSLLECFITLQLDFYLEAIAHYEVGVVLTKHENMLEVTKPNGILTKGLSLYADGAAKTCFDGFLIELMSTIEKVHGGISWRTLAECIDIDESVATGSGDSLNDRKYNQLKDWRKGKNLPSYSKLQMFFIRLFSLDDGEFIDVILAYSKIAMGLDNLFITLKNLNLGLHCSAEEFEITFKRVLGGYPTYYLRCIERQLPKVTSNET